MSRLHPPTLLKKTSSLLHPNLTLLSSATAANSSSSPAQLHSPQLLPLKSPPTPMKKNPSSPRIPKINAANALEQV
jgi:hypothetical protein